ncbi:MAG: hypothetical protein Q7R83_04155 [bacterium]|nr:hypothetical protein [bacterium]
MKISLSKKTWIVLLSIVGVMAALAVFCTVMILGVFYRQWDSAPARGVMSALHVSVATVGSDPVSYETYLTHLGSVERFLSGPAGQTAGLGAVPTPEMKKSILEHAVRIAIIEQLAKERDIIVTPVDLDRSFDALIERAGTSTAPGEVKQALRDQFGWDEKDFKIFVIQPAMQEELIAQKMERDTGDKEAFAKEADKRIKSATYSMHF